MLLDAIFAIGTIVLTEFVRVATTEIIHYWINSPSSVNSGEPDSYIPHASGTSKDFTHELEILDAEVVDLELKQRHDGYMSRKDQERKVELESLRIKKFQDFQKARKKEIAKEQSKNPDNYETSMLKSDNVHILQYHMGQVVLEKKCTTPGCGRPMILNSRQRLDGGLYCLNDFFGHALASIISHHSSVGALKNFKYQILDFCIKQTFLSSRFQTKIYPKLLMITQFDKLL